MKKDDGLEWSHSDHRLSEADQGKPHPNDRVLGRQSEKLRETAHPNIRTEECQTPTTIRRAPESYENCVNTANDSARGVLLPGVKVHG